MKKIYLIIMLTMVMTIPTFATSSAPAPTTEPPAKSAVLIERLEEINAIDKSLLKSTEKRALKKEAKALNRDLGNNRTGVYISVGGIIIIILLLILIL